MIQIETVNVEEEEETVMRKMTDQEVSLQVSFHIMSH